MATATPKKTATTAAPTTPTAPVDSLASITKRMQEEAARATAAHLATYRAAVNALATGGTIAPEEENVLELALKFFKLDTDCMGRDVATVKNIAAMKKNLGETAEERALKDTKLWDAVKESAKALDELRDELKKGEAKHQSLAGQSYGFGIACNELTRLIDTNPRIFAAKWPLPPAEVPQLPQANWPKNDSPTPLPPLPTEIVHPLTHKKIPVTPDQLRKLVADGILQPSFMTQYAKPVEAKPPVHYLDASKIAE